MDATDKTREASKAHRIGGNQFDPMAGEPSAVIASRNDRLEPSLRRIFSLCAVIRNIAPARTLSRAAKCARQDLGNTGHEAALLVSLALSALLIAAVASFLSWMRHAASIKDDHHESED